MAPPEIKAWRADGRMIKEIEMPVKSGLPGRVAAGRATIL
jgi:hypothetical protein